MNELDLNSAFEADAQYIVAIFEQNPALIHLRNAVANLPDRGIPDLDIYREARRLGVDQLWDALTRTERFANHSGASFSYMLWRVQQILRDKQNNWGV